MRLASPATPALRTVALLCLLLAGSPSWADWRSELPGAKLVGQGDFTWFGLRVYQARLWSPVAPMDWEQPFALELIYSRDLSRDTLVQASLDEMRRLGGASVDEKRLAAWDGEMRQAFVDIQPGQRITGLYQPGKGSRFYVDGAFRHAIADPDFAQAFFAIWLDDRTRNPQLRRELLGLNEKSP
ncbi:chalcone isomerase family protein [Pseudomonas tohonis]|uniref:chalcone isomerase family protein n=1 Tax=Pseudomonas tohonis TaxID=2725477 RepID=UPI0021D8B5C8|nr:chalcone isomerase family protein [Pseudomonas tohonis]UXY55195.1 chalcone isomerase family protein [Pseudomonas tohonis]